MDVICLPCCLSPRQVQIWRLSFTASLRIHSPSHTNTHKHTRFHHRNFVSLHLSLYRFCSPLSLRHTHAQMHTNKHTFQLKPQAAHDECGYLLISITAAVELARKPLCAQATSARRWLNYSTQCAGASVCGGTGPHRRLRGQIYTAANAHRQGTHMHAHKIRLANLVLVWTHFSPPSS